MLLHLHVVRRDAVGRVELLLQLELLLQMRLVETGFGVGVARLLLKELQLALTLLNRAA